MTKLLTSVTYNLKQTLRKNRHRNDKTRSISSQNLTTKDPNRREKIKRLPFKTVQHKVKVRVPETLRRLILEISSSLSARFCRPNRNVSSSAILRRLTPEISSVLSFRFYRLITISSPFRFLMKSMRQSPITVLIRTAPIEVYTREKAV